jgi:AbiV family abortive infection protein
MAVAAMNNALSLHRDSIHLYRRSSYGSAVALSVLAAEEIGKCCIVEDVVYSADINGWPPDVQEKELRKTFDHRAKQHEFGQWGDILLTRRLAERIFAGALEHDKQRGLYVGLRRRGRKGVDTSSRVSDPYHVGQRSTERQITMVNDVLVCLCVGCSEDRFQFDIDDVHDGLSLALARELVRRWPWMGGPAKRFVRRSDWWPRWRQLMMSLIRAHHAAKGAAADRPTPRVSARANAKITSQDGK